MTGLTARHASRIARRRYSKTSHPVQRGSAGTTAKSNLPIILFDPASIFTLWMHTDREARVGHDIGIAM